MGTTKDERFVLNIYETAMLKNDPFAPVNRYEVGQRVGLAKTAVDTICKLLIQSNFVKKLGDVEICLTKNGEALALRLRGE